MRVAGFLSALAATLSVALASAETTTIKGFILPSEHLQHLTLLGPTTRVILTGAGDAELASFVHPGGSFAIPNVSPGTYALRVHSPTHAFHLLRLDVPSISSAPIVRRWNPAEPWATAPPAEGEWVGEYPLRLEARAELDWYEKREGFNAAGMLKNPMMLLMGGSVLMMVLMPMLMKNMDPEALKEMQENQNKIASVQNMDFVGGLASFLSGSSPQDGSKEAGDAGKAGAGGSAGGGKRAAGGGRRR